MATLGNGIPDPDSGMEERAKARALGGPWVGGDMTLRDFFAAAALTGLASRGFTADAAGELAYNYADNMLAARINSAHETIV